MMVLIFTGVAVLLVTFVIFWLSLPKNGRKHRFADTGWEPYFAVALTAGIALGLALTLTGVFNLMGTGAGPA